MEGQGTYPKWSYPNYNPTYKRLTQSPGPPSRPSTLNPMDPFLAQVCSPPKLRISIASIACHYLHRCMPSDRYAQTKYYYVSRSFCPILRGRSPYASTASTYMCMSREACVSSFVCVLCSIGVVIVFLCTQSGLFPY